MKVYLLNKGDVCLRAFESKEHAVAAAIKYAIVEINNDNTLEVVFDHFTCINVCYKVSEMVTCWFDRVKTCYSVREIELE